MKTKFYLLSSLLVLTSLAYSLQTSAQNTPRLMGAHMNCGGISHYYIRHDPNETVEIDLSSWTVQGGSISDNADDYTWIEVTWTVSSGSVFIGGIYYKINGQIATPESISVRNCSSTPAGTAYYSTLNTSSFGVNLPSNLRIGSRLYINNTGTFNGVNFYMEPNSTLIVGAGMNGVYFNKCNFYMGKNSRIIFEQNTKVGISNSNIEAYNNHTWGGIRMDEIGYNFFELSK